MSALCLACGLCCDGSLFDLVPLEPAEREPARARGLTVLRSGFAQPCPAHRDGACAIYEERPAACRRFVCKLHERGGEADSAHRVRELRARLQREGFSQQLYDELMSRLETDFARAPSADQ